jgi:tRNA(Ile)-lysidine synthase
LPRAPSAAAAGAPDPAQIWNEIAPAGSGRVRCAVAWSGGLDSTVLMHLMVLLRARHPRRLVLRAVHVDHHLQPAAADFRAHCGKLARRWRVPLAILDVQVGLGPGVSVEEAARESRYAAWRGFLEPGEILLAAQHADDQAETLLLALLRGAGPAGLAAMPRSAALGQGRLLRPLLDLPRSALLGHAVQHGLTWQEDPSNQQLRHDRNYLRAQVIPRLRERWPALAQTMSRSARHCATGAAGMAEVAAADLFLAADGAGLDMSVLRRWPRTRQLAVLRAWFSRAALRSPETRHLDQILAMLRARADAHPQLVLPQATVRVHEARLLLEAPASLLVPAPPRTWRWQRAALPLEAGEIAVVPDRNGDLDLARLPGVLWVRGTGNAPGKGRSLRKLLQELAVPRWERERLPLLYAEGAQSPLAVGDLWLHPDVQARADSRRRGRIVWRPKR